jgi:glucose/mannose-6-phosphate isomerase
VNDPAGMLADVLAQPHQVGDALWRVESARIERADLVGGLLVCGMGGSAIGGDLAAAAIGERAERPIVTSRDYTPPPWLGSDALVLCASYSGNTEETLSAFEAARARGARTLVVTAGGELGARARRDGLPWVRLPDGFPPRAALAFLLVPLVLLLDGLGAGLGGAAEREEAVRVLTALGGELAPEVPAAGNPAKALAAALAGRVPVIYGSELSAAVAYRWRTQFEENTKVLAGSGALPEMNHNALEAWAAADAGRAAWAVVLLREHGEHPRVARRLALTRELIGARTPTYEVWARGDGRLARMLSLVLQGDWVSYYAALVRGADPWAVDALEAFKRRMAAAR